MRALAGGSLSIDVVAAMSMAVMSAALARRRPLPFGLKAGNPAFSRT